MTPTDIKEYIDDEELIIRDGGEMPEVTFHNSLYFLTEDQNGPLLSLDERDILRLKQAVVYGYRRIMLRDLQLENRDRSLYRGMERCHINWDRLEKFAEREALDITIERQKIAEALIHFMATEVAEVVRGERTSSINCSHDDLCSFCCKLAIPKENLPSDWKKIFTLAGQMPATY